MSKLPVYPLLACLLWLSYPLAVQGRELTSLQALVDAADPGGILVPPPGVYAGPVVIRSPLTLDGRAQVTVDGGGRGSVVVIETNGATIKNLHLTNSGESHNDIDSGVQVRGDFNVIKHNRIDNSLFGVDLQQARNNIVRNNRISSKPFELGVRGDAIRLWYSFDNKITDNQIRDSRDTVVWYSRGNLIARNDARGGRYSLHFMYSEYNEVIGNHYEDNSVGIFLMYSDGVRIKDNYIANATGATGMGIGFKETSDVEVSGNRVLRCATGLYLDLSPFQPDTTNRFTGNLVAYNGIGVRFLSDWHGSHFRDNRFTGNLTQVAVSGGGKTANRNLWEGNHWDDYKGFDQDADGIGDTPYELYSYVDRLWMDVPPTQFFKGAPVLEVLDFMERLAPFSEPNMLVRDKLPVMAANQAFVSPAKDQSAPVVEPVKKPFDALEALRESLRN